jgi:hypothetical protein
MIEAENLPHAFKQALSQRTFRGMVSRGKRESRRRQML